MDKYINELKHSIKIHLLIMSGPSQQLCVFLMKLIDLIEDTDIDRVNAETAQLSFSIIESVAIHIQNAIDTRYSSSKDDNKMPEHIRRHADEIIVAVGKSRSHMNKIEAKNSVLSAVAKALDALSSFTGAVYPTLFDSAGNQLNNNN